MAAVLLLLLVLLAALSAALHAADTTTHLHLFMHDVASGSSPTAVQVIKGPGTAQGMSFGDTSVMDDLLTSDSSPTSAAVGRMQGFYMFSSQSSPVLMVCANLLLTSGDYNGSTVAVMGRDDIMAAVRELAVIGGTGRFRMATGYVLWKTTSMNGADATVELDVYVSTGANGTAADGGGSGGSSGSGSGSKASSGTARAVVSGGGWVNACVVAVVVAVVGSCVW